MRSDFQVFLLGQLTHQQIELAHPQNTPQIDRTYGYDELGHLIQTRTHCPQQPFEAPHQTQYQESKNAQTTSTASKSACLER